jgi:2-polyprenyl-3-methyl-5-hydroxy-6-metoxy-1,4-benzoquinol methylase
VRGHGTVLDFGCGRGEFLDLLSEAGVAAVGVDMDPAMVARAREKGHEVEQAEGVSYLESRGTGAFGAIFASHVLEHLPHEALLRFFRAARTALEPGGLLVAETVNPHSLRAFKTFWTDPTHRAPLFPEVAIELCRAHGFRSARVMFPRGGGDSDADLRRATEYAIVATSAGRS